MGDSLDISPELNLSLSAEQGPTASSETAEDRSLIVEPDGGSVFKILREDPPTDGYHVVADGREHLYYPAPKGSYGEPNHMMARPSPAPRARSRLAPAPADKQPNLSILGGSTIGPVDPLDGSINGSVAMPTITGAPLPVNDGSGTGEGPHQDGDYSPYLDFHKTLHLRDYQTSVAEKSLRGENDIILLPTGTGKTYVAIKVIIEHLYLHRDHKPKAVFLVPTGELAIQQLKKIQDHLPHAWYERSRKITGECNVPAEQLISIIQSEHFVVLVVTPAIIMNYFAMSRDGSVSNFSLLIFDEYHHAKKEHPYNELINKCIAATADAASKGGSDQPRIPQLIGMTATIGIGDSLTLRSAEEYIIGMCAKFNLDSPPSESQELFAISQMAPEEDYETVSSRRNDAMSRWLQDHLMTPLEDQIASRLRSPVFEANESLIKAAFPEDRYAQTYEHYVVSLRDTITQFHAIEDLREHTNHCMVALEHLLVYYKTIQLINLLNCEHGMKYLDEMDAKPLYRGIASIWTLYTDNLPNLRRLQKEVDAAGSNEKIEKLTQRLRDLFASKRDSKVIIFVQMRVVAQYLADLLNQLNPTFKAKEFTSTGPSAEDAGMKPQQRFDAREGFEEAKYNILVATSVLEEGIDIQACNMVVRYMYVKDMIAKIQSRGRARHESGVIIALLDMKLREQERKNNYKEELMYKALDQLRTMPPAEFQSRVAAQLALMRMPKPASPGRGVGITQKAKISCKMCGFYLGDMVDVRKYGLSHFLIIDGSLCEKVRPFPGDTGMRAMDGMVPYGKLLCKGGEGKSCSNKVGTLMKMDSGMHFGMWYIKGINVNDKPLKKYKEVAAKHGVNIEPITIAELNEVGPDHQFPEHLLQPAALVGDML